MSPKRTTALAATTIAAAFSTAAPALAMPAAPDPVSSPTPAPVVVQAPASPIGDTGGVGTLVVVLLSSGALVAGAAAGFGTGRRTTLHHG